MAGAQLAENLRVGLGDSATADREPRSYEAYANPLAGSALLTRVRGLLGRVNAAGLLGGEATLRKRWGARCRALSPLHRASLGGASAGEVLLTLFIVAQLAESFSTRSISGSGEAPDMVLSLALVFAMRNSLLNELLGLSWQRGVQFHMLTVHHEGSLLLSP